MYEPKEPGPASAQVPPQARRVIGWLEDRGTVEQVLQTSLGELPSERDVALARMGDVLQATAQGLSRRAAAVWANIPEHVLQGWIDQDPAFAAALDAAAHLAAAHGIRPGKQSTPAMLRVLLVAMGKGTTKTDAMALAGFRHTEFRALLKASSALEDLLEAARRVRPPKPRGTYVPGKYRPRRPGRKPPPRGAFRLVQRGAPEAPRDDTDV
ncbi:hypothetical protein [Streptomyces sp. NPDC001903]|uniref:hypothetical protein n=1 Tax=Streptomyces sp. NPDC001903 TaxID=3364622 RepID=UPI00369A397A